ncbi:putative porin, partial [bacterium]|nr:putative porin [bacterium]
FMATSAFAASAYDDVPRDHWAYNALDYLTDRGVLEGYPDGFFKGDRTLTRYEFAQAVARLLDTIGDGNSDEQIRIMADTLRAEFADQLAEIGRTINEMYGVVNDMDARVGDLEARVDDNSSKISSLENAIKGFKPGWQWKGVLYYRWQFDNQGDYERFRQRIIFAIGYSKQINDAVEVGFRLKTGTGSYATNGNFTMGNYWKTADIWLDRAYVKFSPAWFGFYTDKDCNECTPKLDIYAGIFDRDPVVYDPHEMILDSDIGMQGAGLVYHFNRDFQISTVASIVVERNGADYFDDDVWFYATEIRHDNLLLPCLDAWVGCYGWDNENYMSGVYDNNAFYNFDFNNDGLIDGQDRFTPNYNTIKGGLQYTFHCLLPKPLAVYGEYMMNVDSDAEDRIDALNPFVTPDFIYDTTDDTGWMAGFQYGAKPKHCGDWYGYARYKEIGANAVIHGFADATTGGANRNSLEVGWGWMWADNCVLGLTYVMHKMHNAFGFAIPSHLDDANTVIVDWIFTF